MTRGKQSSEYAISVYAISLIFIMAVIGANPVFAGTIGGIAMAKCGVAGAKKWKHGEK